MLIQLDFNIQPSILRGYKVSGIPEDLDLEEKCQKCGELVFGKNRRVELHLSGQREASVKCECGSETWIHFKSLSTFLYQLSKLLEQDVKIHLWDFLPSQTLFRVNLTKKE